MSERSLLTQLGMNSSTSHDWSFISKQSTTSVNSEDETEKMTDNHTLNEQDETIFSKTSNEKKCSTNLEQKKIEILQASNMYSSCSNDIEIIPEFCDNSNFPDNSKENIDFPICDSSENLNPLNELLLVKRHTPEVKDKETQIPASKHKNLFTSLKEKISHFAKVKRPKSSGVSEHINSNSAVLCKEHISKICTFALLYGEKLHFLLKNPVNLIIILFTGLIIQSTMTWLLSYIHLAGLYNTQLECLRNMQHVINRCLLEQHRYALQNGHTSVETICAHNNMKYRNEMEKYLIPDVESLFQDFDATYELFIKAHPEVDLYVIARQLEHFELIVPKKNMVPLGLDPASLDLMEENLNKMDEISYNTYLHVSDYFRTFRRIKPTLHDKRKVNLPRYDEEFDIIQNPHYEENIMHNQYYETLLTLTPQELTTYWHKFSQNLLVMHRNYSFVSEIAKTLTLNIENMPDFTIAQHQKEYWNLEHSKALFLKFLYMEDLNITQHILPSDEFFIVLKYMLKFHVMIINIAGSNYISLICGFLKVSVMHLCSFFIFKSSPFNFSYFVTHKCLFHVWPWYVFGIMVCNSFIEIFGSKDKKINVQCSIFAYCVQIIFQKCKVLRHIIFKF